MEADYTGRVLGNWRLVRVLGSGSFGGVYEAENVSIAGRRAAVKILHPHLSLNDAIKRRFLNEASAASRAEHENIVQIFDGGIEPDGTCYSVMELLKGCTLGGLIGFGRIGTERTINIGVQIASALQAAHSIHIVHRDLKPENIFVVARAANHEFVKVLDFGVAKLRGEQSRPTATLEGVQIGTPAYMSPEQWMGASDLDGRADIYSLGVILYECLNGRLPFRATSVYEWQEAHLNEPAPDFSSHTPSAMARLVLRMLAKSREERPAEMRDVEMELRAIGGPTVVHAIEASSSGPTVFEAPPSDPLAGLMLADTPPALPPLPTPEAAPRPHASRHAWMEETTAPGPTAPKVERTPPTPAFKADEVTHVRTMRSRRLAVLRRIARRMIRRRKRAIAISGAGLIVLSTGLTLLLSLPRHGADPASPTKALDMEAPHRPLQALKLSPAEIAAVSALEAPPKPSSEPIVQPPIHLPARTIKKRERSHSGPAPKPATVDLVASTERDLREGIESIRGQAVACMEPLRGVVEVRMMIAPSGSVVDVAVVRNTLAPVAAPPSRPNEDHPLEIAPPRMDDLPPRRVKRAQPQKTDPAAPTGAAAAGDCVASAVKAARFRPFKGSPISIAYPFVRQ